MQQHFYHTSQFAKKAGVTVRTLRYYDNVGLLSPSQHTDAGYRLYTDADFFRLQQILALKFLGFPLEDIKACLRIGPTVLQESLAIQKAMMQEQKTHLETIIKTIDETEKLLATNTDDWEAIIRVIRIMQTRQTDDWRRKYFTEEQLQKAEDLSQKHYTDAQRQQLAAWGKDFSEEDQLRATQAWNEVFATLQYLVSSGQEPASPDAQTLAARWYDLIHQFTHGDPGIQQGLQTMHAELSTMPAEEVPFPLPPYNQEESQFIQKAIQIYRQKLDEPNSYKTYSESH